MLARTQGSPPTQPNSPFLMAIMMIMVMMRVMTMIKISVMMMVVLIVHRGIEPIIIGN